MNIKNESTLNIDTSNADILLVTNAGSEEVLRISSNGDFFKRGKMIGNDKEIIEAFREFLINQGYLNK